MKRRLLLHPDLDPETAGSMQESRREGGFAPFYIFEGKVYSEWVHGGWAYLPQELRHEIDMNDQSGEMDESGAASGEPDPVVVIPPRPPKKPRTSSGVVEVYFEALMPLTNEDAGRLCDVFVARWNGGTGAHSVGLLGTTISPEARKLDLSIRFVYGPVRGNHPSDPRSKARETGEWTARRFGPKRVHFCGARVVDWEVREIE